MPCHADRVRRSYHDITIEQRSRDITDDYEIRLHVSRAQIATAMSKRELEDTVLRVMKTAITEQYPS